MYLNKRILLTWVVFIVSVSVFAQKQANVWYFGSNAGISFNSNSPFALTNGALVSYEGCASICAPSGQLLFYTDGQKVWSANHQVMPNGQGLAGHVSATQSSIIIPRPGHKDRYYIFTLDREGLTNGLKYSEVNMSLNLGFGDVTGTKNVSMITPLTEKLTATRHSNGIDYWVLVHGTIEGSNTANAANFYAFKVTENGPSTTPVTTTLGNAHLGASGKGTIGYMKFSPNGKKVALAVGVNSSNKFVELFDFDAENGTLSNPLTIDGYDIAPYGIEFSPDSKRLYVTSGKSLFQYTIPDVKNSGVLRFSQKEFTSDENIWAIQLGPDKKLYFCKQNTTIGTINFPNNEASTAGFTDNSFSLNGRWAVQGFPNFVTNYFAENYIVAENLCENQPTQFGFLINGMDSIQWDFGDNPSYQGNRAKGLTPTYTYRAAGVYTVAATIYYNGNAETFSHQIVINRPPQFTLGNDTVLCKSQYLSVKLNIPGASYLWNNGSKAGNRIITTPGMHFVDVTSMGCITRDSVRVTYNILNSDFSIDKPIQCFKNNTFTFTSNDTKTANKWLIDFVPAGTGVTKSHSFTASGIHKITHVLTSTHGCIDSTTKDIKINPDIKADFTIAVGNNCGTSNKFFFTNNSSYSGTYTTEFEVEGKKLTKSPVEWSFSKPGTYTIKLTAISAEGCSDEISKQVTVFDGPDASFATTINKSCDIDNSFSFKKNTPLKSYETIEWVSGGTTIKGKEEINLSFPAAGTYPVKLTITNLAGCSVTTETEVVVYSSPTVSFTTSKNTTSCLGSSPVEFINNTSGEHSIQRYDWDFGDNTSSTDKNPIKTFAPNSTFLVSLTATNDKGCKVTAVNTLTTFEKPKADVSIKTLSACETDNRFEFSFSNTNPSAPVSSYSWKDEAGKIYFANPLPITFTAKGKNTLELKIVSQNGCEDISTHTVTVFENPKGTITVNNNGQCLDLNAFVLGVNRTNDVAIANYVWKLGNGNELSAPTPTANYLNPGKYTIQLDAKSAEGCEGSFEPIEVTVHPTPVFEIVSIETCDKQPARLKIQGLDNFIPIREWLWDLGDGELSTMPQPIYTYPHSGSYTLTATAVSDKGCRYVTSKANAVNVVKLPTADFTHHKKQWGFDETVIEFIPEVSGDVNSYKWDFGNGQLSTKQTELITYEKAGYYTVALEVANKTGCVTKVSKEILIVPPFDAYVPTSFTPNGDGKNDYFGMDGVEFISSYKMQIFNRWGQEIFVSNDLNHRWDGRSDDVAMPTDMYSYAIKIIDAEGRPYALNGTIHLIR